MRKYFIFILFLASTLKSRAVDSNDLFPVKVAVTPKVTNYLKADYKAENQNWAASSSKSGAVYFANSLGLLRFDGEDWSLYPTNNILRSVYCQGDTIYVGGNGIMGYFLENDIESGFKSLASIHSDIWKIYSFDNYVIFQSFNRLYHINKSGHVGIERISSGNTTFTYPINNEIYYQVSYGKLMAVKPNRGERIVSELEELKQYKVKFIGPSDDNSLILGTLNNGLFKLHNNNLYPLDSYLNTYLKTNRLNTILRLDKDLYAFATMNGGIVISKLDGEIKYIINKTNGLSSNRIHGLLEQSNEHLWIATDNGVAFINLVSPMFYLNNKLNKLGTFYDAVVFNQQFYVATNKGLFATNPINNSPNVFEVDLVRGSEGQVWNLNVIGDELWVGHNDGTYLLENNQFKKISDKSGGYSFIQSRSNPNIMYQTSYYGLIVYSKDEKDWQYSYSIDNMEGLTRDLIELKDGTLITTGALKEAYHITVDHSLKNVQIEDLSKHIAFSQSQWIRAFELNNQAYLVANDTTLIFDNGVMKPAPEIFDDITYISEEIGDYCFIRREGELELYNFKTEGIIEIAYDLEHIEKDLVYKYEKISKINDSSCFFCLTEGVAMADLNELIDTSVKSKQPKITSIEFSNNRNGEKADLNNFNSIPYYYNTVEISFTNFNYESKTVYEYLLEGYSQKWQSVTSSNHVVFQNLREGEYTFKVKQKGSKDFTKFTFFIKPPYNRTAYAYIIYVIIAIIFYVTSIRIYRIVIKKQEYNRLLSKRKKLYENQLKRSKEMLGEEVKELQTEVLSKNDKLSKLLLQNNKKKEVIEGIQEELKQIRKSEKYVSSRHIDKLTRMIRSNLDEKQDWLMFEAAFSDVHANFFKKLKAKHPKLTDEDLKLCAYLKVNLSSKELAPIFQITTRSVDLKKYRLKKKLGLGKDQGLKDYIVDFEG